MELANGYAMVRALGVVRLVFITKFSRIGPDWCFSSVFFFAGPVHLGLWDEGKQDLCRHVSNGHVSIGSMSTV